MRLGKRQWDDKNWEKDSKISAAGFANVRWG